MEMGSPAWKVHPLCIAMNPSMYQYIDWSGPQIWPLVPYSPDVAVIDQPQAQFFKKSDLWALDHHSRRRKTSCVCTCGLWLLGIWLSCPRPLVFGGPSLEDGDVWDFHETHHWLTSLNPNPEHLTFLQGAGRTIDYYRLLVVISDCEHYHIKE